MTEVTAKIVGKKLIIEVPINDPPVPSATGKTLVVASSHGNKEVEAMVAGQRVIVGVNAYIKKPRG